MFVVIRHFEQKQKAESRKQLHNNVNFSGKIVSIKQSSNHNFGIVFLQVTHISSATFTQDLGNTKFPYAINNNKAEVYTRIPDGIMVGDSVSVKSNEVTIYYFDNKGIKKTEEFIYMIDDPNELTFIAANTNFSTP
jgi:hypothetical protein